MSHAYRSCYFHLIFHTKRCPIRTEDIELLHAYMCGILKNKGCRNITIGGIENHVHLLVEVAPDKVSTAIGAVKSSSTLWLKRRDPKAYKAFAWQTSSSQFTVSFSNTEKVRQYIKTQREHHSNLSARDELVKFLDAHHVPYEPGEI